MPVFHSWAVVSPETEIYLNEKQCSREDRIGIKMGT